jgi:hypothetical protein
MKQNEVRCALFLLRFLQACAARKCNGRSRGVVPSPAISSPHRLSLAGCSPAEPASVSPDTNSLRFASLLSNVCCASVAPQPQQGERQ